MSSVQDRIQKLLKTKMTKTEIRILQELQTKGSASVEGSRERDAALKLEARGIGVYVSCNHCCGYGKNGAKIPMYIGGVIHPA